MIDATTLAEHFARRRPQRLSSTLRIQQQQLDLAQRRYLVAVVNLSTDSPYGDSVATNVDHAERLARYAIAHGADAIELGAESTATHSISRSASEQLTLLVPAIERIRQLNVPIAVESYDPIVLDAAAEAGAALFNVTGYERFSDILAVAEARMATVILPYLSGRDARRLGPITAEDSVNRMRAFLLDVVGQARSRGVECVVDPGLGFDFQILGVSRLAYQLEMYLSLHEIAPPQTPVLTTLVHAQSVFRAGLRKHAEPFFATIALLSGANFLRTHEVAAVSAVRDILDSTPARPTEV